ncbi:hypothetical protein BD311DRAFT_381354 [Dichomitus squalens]|uniref:Uncharacterized protein n=1 Tax=Dichomitus squalens TaxID=114155 RepID=A0A4Q9MIH5_9APHY|nr:hypothetical protein BD311DRAFT_381354 [Dichomitus squalens]
MGALIRRNISTRVDITIRMYATTTGNVGGLLYGRRREPRSGHGPASRFSHSHDMRLYSRLYWFFATKDDVCCINIVSGQSVFHMARGAVYEKHEP